MKVEKVLVVGAGIMGRGIAQVSAQAGYQTVMSDINETQLQQAKDSVFKNWDRDVEKGRRAAEDADAAKKRFSIAKDLEDARNCQLVIEAVSENIALKLDLFKRLHDLTPPETILASNTSSIPITQLATATKRPDQVIGIHFMNPVPVMKLVEIVLGLQTGREAIKVAEATCKAMGKETVIVKRDFPGFIVNRICVPIINDAAWLLHDGMGSVEDIDKAIHFGLNHPMGPLTLGDFIGLDTTLAILEILFDGYKDIRYRPCPLLRQLVQAGQWGRKTGRGFYDYSGKQPVPAL